MSRNRSSVLGLLIAVSMVAGGGLILYARPDGIMIEHPTYREQEPRSSPPLEWVDANGAVFYGVALIVLGIGIGVFSTWRPRR